MLRDPIPAHLRYRPHERVTVEDDPAGPVRLNVLQVCGLEGEHSRLCPDSRAQKAHEVVAHLVFEGRRPEDGRILTHSPEEDLSMDGLIHQ